MKRNIIVLAGLLAVAGCSEDKKEQPQPAAPVTPKPKVALQFMVDGQALTYDMISYVNAAGNNYGVTRLQFYLSDFVFESQTGSQFVSDAVFYVDARKGTNTTIGFDNLPWDSYKKVSFLVGLDSTHNITGALPATLDNENMAWPAQMGGGYHFMKFEGSFIEQGNTFGFAMHLGMNNFLVQAMITDNFDLSESTPTLTLQMNLNEWFVNPFVYDFNVDGNYSMGNQAAMGKLSSNGVDVFTIN